MMMESVSGMARWMSLGLSGDVRYGPDASPHTPLVAGVREQRQVLVPILDPVGRAEVGGFLELKRLWHEDVRMLAEILPHGGRARPRAPQMKKLGSRQGDCQAVGGWAGRALPAESAFDPENRRHTLERKLITLEAVGLKGVGRLRAGSAPGARERRSSGLPWRH
jgi:hypothetical protein